MKFALLYRHPGHQPPIVEFIENLLLEEKKRKPLFLNLSPFDFGGKKKVKGLVSDNFFSVLWPEKKKKSEEILWTMNQFKDDANLIFIQFRQQRQQQQQQQLQQKQEQQLQQQQQQQRQQQQQQQHQQKQQRQRQQQQREQQKQQQQYQQRITFNRNQFCSEFFFQF